MWKSLKRDCNTGFQSNERAERAQWETGLKWSKHTSKLKKKIVISMSLIA